MLTNSINHQLSNRSNTQVQSLSTSLNKSQTNKIKGGGLMAELIPTSAGLMRTRADVHPCGGQEYGTPRNLTRLTTELHGAEAL